MWYIRINWKLACVCQNRTPGKEKRYFRLFMTQSRESGEYNIIENPKRFKVEINKN